LIAPKLNELLRDCGQFVSRGEGFLRDCPTSAISKVMISLNRYGIDCQKAVASIMEELRGIVRSRDDFRRSWLVLLGRITIILGFSLVMRRFFLSAMSRETWVQWMDVDYLAVLVGALCISILLFWSLHRYIAFGWDREHELRLWRVFLDFVSCGQFGTTCPVVGPRLEEIRRNELETGIDGRHARETLLRERLLEMNVRLKEEIEAMALIGVAIELSSFLFGHLGFSLVPFLAWIASASGVD